MKRLKYFLLGMEPNNTTYKEMYNGELLKQKTFYFLGNGNSRDVDEECYQDSRYWNEDIGFKITHTNKLLFDLPTVTINIPIEKLFNNNEGEMYLKRLKFKLLQIEPNNTIYTDIYEGRMDILSNLPPEPAYDSTYWRETVGFNIDRTNKLALDKPTVNINIPAEQIGIVNINNINKTYNQTAADYCLRAFKPYIDELNEANYNRSRPDKENGKYYIYAPTGKVLNRNTAYFMVMNPKYYINMSGNAVKVLEECNPPAIYLNIMLQVQLPYKKHRKAIQMLTKDLPDAVDNFILNFDSAGLNAALKLEEKQTAIRSWLKSSDYCAFIANGSVLPRSKDTDLPLEDAVPFKSTSNDEIEICDVRGMGIKRGVVVITGGGYSGKSTLLDAISAGIYNHIIGDGRELVITDDSAMKISAEDGRSVKNVNISPFIKWLPGGNTANFSTEHASGSTSQAANIMEAVNYGSKLLLIDEDKSATNFMIRDRMMKELIEKEPITPFTDRVNELYEKNSVSTILVIGGSGEYLSVADKIFMMQDYLIGDVTEQAKSICLKANISTERPKQVDWKYIRTLNSERFSSYPEDSGTEVLQISDMGFIFIGDERIDIRMLHNIVSTPQLNAIGFMLRYLEVTNNESRINIERRIDEIYTKIEKEGLDTVFTSFFVNCERWFDLPRKNELLAVINRMRKIKFIQGQG